MLEQLSSIASKGVESISEVFKEAAIKSANESPLQASMETIENTSLESLRAQNEVMDGAKHVVGNAIDYVIENPGKTALAVVATVATDGLATAAAPMITAVAGEAGLLTETVISRVIVDGAQVGEGKVVVAGARTIVTAGIEKFPLNKLESPNTLDLLAQEMPNKCMDITELDRPLHLNDVASFVPVNNGVWETSKGDSDWTPENDYVPLKNNPEQQTWAQIKEEYKFESIPFDKGEADFTEVSKVTVEIEDFSTDRNSNFTQADEKCAEQWTLKNMDEKSWSPGEVKAYRKEHDLSWHERGDQRTIDLVPSIIHGNVTHTGGISAAKSGESNG